MLLQAGQEIAAFLKKSLSSLPAHFAATSRHMAVLCSAVWWKLWRNRRLKVQRTALWHGHSRYGKTIAMHGYLGEMANQ
jgi:hypothetical protein